MHHILSLASDKLQNERANDDPRKQITKYGTESQAFGNGNRNDRRTKVYQEGGLRRYSIRQLLAPFEQTTRLCNMHYLPPFMIHGTHLLDENSIEEAKGDYRKVIQSLRDGIFNPEDLMEHEYVNDLIH